MAIQAHQFPASESPHLTRADVAWLRGLGTDYGEDSFLTRPDADPQAFAAEVVFTVDDARRYLRIMDKLDALDLPPE